MKKETQYTKTQWDAKTTSKREVDSKNAYITRSQTITCFCTETRRIINQASGVGVDGGKINKRSE